MPTQRNVYMAANLLVQQHGKEAPLFAAMNMESLAERGDQTGRALWLRVLDAIKEIQAREPARGTRIH
jgi:hypothetical protein